MSMDTIASLFCSSIFAAVTYWLPGPSSLSTCISKRHFRQTDESATLQHLERLQFRWPIQALMPMPEKVLQSLASKGNGECSRMWQTFGQVSVPHARAATAWAPPAFRTWVTPAFLAQYSTSGVTCSPTVICEPSL